MGTALGQLLKSLCTNSGWNYAVFWKLRHQYPKFLSLEDGYFDHPKPRTGMENLSDMLCFDGTSYTPPCDESSLIYGCTNQYLIGRLLADMSCLQYAVGEGLVGKAACTGNDYWISPDFISATDQLKYDEPSEFPDEWISQFWAGIKTVLLVPVLPHGVLQLGSLEVVGEDTTISDRIKERYYAYRILSGSASSSASKTDGPSHASLNFIASFMDEMDDPSTVICNLVDEPLSEESEDSTNSNRCDMLVFDPDLPLPDVLEDAVANNDLASLQGLPLELIQIEQPSVSDQLELLQNSLFSASGLEEDLPGFSNYNSLGLFDKFYPGIVTEETGFENMSSLFNFATNCELNGILGPALNSQVHGFPEDGYLSIGDLPSSFCFTGSQDFLDSMEKSAGDFGDFHGIDGAEDLLEAVTCNLYGSVGYCSPNSSEDLKPTITTLDCEFVASAKVPTEPEAATLGDYSFPQRNTEETITKIGGNASRKTSTSAALKSVVNTLNDKEKLTGRKRKGRPGDNQKPRPRDRQLIQDRVKELRELVPNSSKCSIDALLDRAIKHLAFLRGVTNQAERLRNCMPPKESRPKIWRTLGIEDDHKRGKSRTFDFGSKFQVYPIVVEDLEECPGHLLIEVLCDEQGLLLEIAQVIGRLDLTILKGNMESRADNNWACFIVEASPSFQKTDIFWPLMQVLQLQGNHISPVV